jgi:hypothetical protein
MNIAGTHYVAPLGSARLGVGSWRIERGARKTERRESAILGWVELVTDDDPPATLGGVRLASRSTLLVGEAIAVEGSPEIVLRIGAT